MFLLRDILDLSYPFIGEKLGNRDHTTVIHACEKITKEMNKNQAINQKILMIRSGYIKDEKTCGNVSENHRFNIE